MITPVLLMSLYDNGVYIIICAVEDIGGDNFLFPEKSPSSESETRTDLQGTLCTENVFIFIIITTHSFLCFSIGPQGSLHDTNKL